jgi:hypothetical protein
VPVGIASLQSATSNFSWVATFLDYNSLEVVQHWSRFNLQSANSNS